MVGAVDSQQQIVLTPVASARESFSVWAATQVSCSDAVVLEATANAWVLYDQLTRLSGSVTVAHPLAVKLISAARVKTDARDTIKLARSLSANLIPAVSRSPGSCARAYAPWSPIGNDSSSSEAKLAIACKECCSATI